ncbi:hypothetical protein GX50_07985 [[Emmonsia] crescens]|uniref:F-box domain-containing protein n=1 Tax=[Emmonsia] crescens TaxID=73230 RepID=A0A2B7Z778_9EURO|nr:hypothetical protein GX50_07985 [Emmonsia crescens]
MRWNHLPIELVHLIISNSSLRHHDLASLARVDRCLAEIVPQYLYLDVQFISANPSHESECFCLECLAKFNRSITRNPGLAGLTRSIAIRIYVEDDDAVDCIWGVLAKLYALEKLVLSTATEDKMYLVLQRNLLSRLRCAEIYGGFANLAVAAAYMHLPAMEYLTVEGRCVPLRGRHPAATRLPPTMERQTSLKKLTLRVPSEASSILPRILSCCPKLTTFAFSIKNRVNVLLERILLSSALSCCQETITTLELNCEYGEYFECRPIVLRQLKNLRALKIDIIFLFSDDERDEPVLRNDIHKWLPSSLEDLEILFQHIYRAFETAALLAADDAPPNSSPTYRPEYLNWLLQIAMNKEAHLPNLLHVWVREGNSVSPSPHNGSDLPAEIEVPFREAGIDIELSLLPSDSRPF